MEIKKMERVIVESFHYDNHDEYNPHQKLDFTIQPVYHVGADGQKEPAKDGTFVKVSLDYDLAPQPGDLSFSGIISQVVLLQDYYGDGQDLTDEEYQLMSQPLMETLGTVIYQITQVTLEQPLNLEFGMKPTDEDSEN
ncbi:MAG: DUF1149 family protein [Lactobacillus sp.]|jgi:hypothetical protein|nr:DUF1149 family protein [Lactobacillus sp.]MCH3906607.1 DUF1149 family protein [Lactobacillus sp.]MCH3989757.1 DUF1149 family protein [Lactobacillus sp.]MCH4068077.1 DUF1149 family protein [Lactobacillus sp.]MCI1303967.1 DUF1149 family protein [Lactobacillus sp.]